MSRGIAFTVGIAHGALYALLDDVARLRSAVAIEIVVAIDAVFVLHVNGQGLLQDGFFLVSQVEHLFGHHTAKASVFFLEQPIGIGSQLVIGQSENETKGKEWLFVVENSIIEGNIESSLTQIVITKGSMPIETVNFVMGLTSEQTDLDGIHPK